MKFVITTVLVFMSTIAASAFAAEACVQIPNEGIEYKTMNVNFDGSVTFTEPRVFVNGQFADIYDGRETAQGFCQILDKHQVTYKGWSRHPKLFAFLNEDGTLNSTANTEYLDIYTIEQITCR